MQHYGILRNKDENGIYESVSKHHSWNSHDSLSGPLLFKLNRHSDHHSHTFKPYQILRRFDDAPYHSMEFLHCMILILVPPLWFYMVNPRVDALRDFSLGKNTSPYTWNNMQTFSSEDKKTQCVGWLFFAVW
jgi:alkane 1-monooxygenase